MSGNVDGNAMTDDSAKKRLETYRAKVNNVLRIANDENTNHDKMFAAFKDLAKYSDETGDYIENTYTIIREKYPIFCANKIKDIYEQIKDARVHSRDNPDSTRFWDSKISRSLIPPLKLYIEKAPRGINLCVRAVCLRVYMEEIDSVDVRREGVSPYIFSGDILRTLAVKLDRPLKVDFSEKMKEYIRQRMSRRIQLVSYGNMEMVRRKVRQLREDIELIGGHFGFSRDDLNLVYTKMLLEDYYKKTEAIYISRF